MTSSKILVADKLSPDGIALLEAAGFLVDVKIGLPPKELVASIPEYSAILVRSDTQVTSDVIRAGSNLQVIARAGVGVDNIDVEAATEKGIIVVNSPTGNVAAAAEHTVALMLSCARNVVQAGKGVSEGKWERSKLVGVQVKGKVLGIVGLGKVGLHVARCANGLGMRVIATDPYASPSIAEKNNVELSTFDKVISSCDFLTLHTPLIASTKGMISSHELNQMKPGSFIINVARGGLVDETALLAAIGSGHIRGAAVDVFPEEPIPANSASELLVRHPKVVATPHLGASTAEAQVQVAVDVCEQVRDVLRGLLPRSPINAPIILPSEFGRLQPYVKLIERMGDLFTQHFSTTGGNADSMGDLELTYSGEIASMTNSTPLLAALIRGLTKRYSQSAGRNVNVVNASQVAKERGIIVSERKIPQGSTSGLYSQYSNLVTLKGPSSGDDKLIAGFCAEGDPIIVRIGGFRTRFRPQGTLLIARNYDQPGMIGFVGAILGKVGVNINSMTVAPHAMDSGEKGKTGEALMILELEKGVGSEVLSDIQNTEGIMKTHVIEMD